MTIWAKLDKFPPVLIRLLARKGGEAMTDAEISSAATLPIGTVKRLSYTKQWDDVPIEEAMRFMKACGCDIDDRETFRNLNRYLKNPRFEHLRRHKQWPQFQELLAVFAETLQ